MASPDQGYERLGGKQGTLNFSLFAWGSTFGGVIGFASTFVLRPWQAASMQLADLSSKSTV